MKRENGITLIALVITIIILLILVGVALSTLTGQGNIIENAENVVGIYNEKARQEQEELKKIQEYLERYNGGQNQEPDETLGMSGTGTEADPYIIESIEDLVLLSESVENGENYSGKIIKLGRNLDFENASSYIDATRTDIGKDQTKGLMEEMLTGIGFTPIGKTDGNPFSGDFDGQGYTISNIYENTTDKEDYLGLFGKVENGSINNVKVTGTIQGDSEKTNGTYYVGGVVGSIASNSNIEIRRTFF